MTKKTTSKTTTETEQVATPVIVESATIAVEKKSRKPKAVKATAATESSSPVVESTDPVTVTVPSSYSTTR